MPDARIDQLADAARAVIEAAANDPDAVYVTCEDVPEIDPENGWPPACDVTPSPPRWVYVMAPQYADAGPMTRGEQGTNYTLDILTVERCEDAGPVPLAWRRERTAWVQEKIVATLTDARTPLDGTAYPDTFELNWVVSELAERKLFFCLVSITYIEHA